MKIVPMVQPIQGMEIDQAYRHWRIHLMISMYVGYGVFYLTRKSFNFAMPQMLSELGLDYSDLVFSVRCSTSLTGYLNLFLV